MRPVQRLYQLTSKTTALRKDYDIRGASRFRRPMPINGFADSLRGHPHPRPALQLHL